tara:strand:- start:16854 stop:17927 length:1074 start_codon:yes stop_codon:yes gene_type:complete
MYESFNYRKNLSSIKIEINNEDYLNLINLSSGLYNPIKKFCNLKECNTILNKNKFENLKCTLPILLNCKKKNNLETNKNYRLFYKKKNVGLINLESCFKINKKKFAKKIYNTLSHSHPSVKKLFKEKNSYISGRVFMYHKKLPKDKDFILNNLKTLKKIDLKKYICFTTRNIWHLGHEHILKSLQSKKFKFIIFFIQSEKNKYVPKEIIKSYRILFKKKIFAGSKIFKLYMPALMAGPREAYLQAQMLNNLKMKNFIIGRDHAGYKNFFSKYASQSIFKKKKGGMNIKIFKTKEPLMCSSCSKIGTNTKKVCSCKEKGNKLLTIDGKKIRFLMKLKRFEELKKYLDPSIFRLLTKKK